MQARFATRGLLARFAGGRDQVRIVRHAHQAAGVEPRAGSSELHGRVRDRQGGGGREGCVAIRAAGVDIRSRLCPPRAVL